MSVSQLGDRKAYLTYTSISLFITEGRQGRNLEIEADAKATEGTHQSFCSACFLQEPITTSPGIMPLTTNWGFPHQPLRKCPRAGFYEVISSIESPLWITPA